MKLLSPTSPTEYVWSQASDRCLYSTQEGHTSPVLGPSSWPHPEPEDAAPEVPAPTGTDIVRPGLQGSDPAF